MAKRKLWWLIGGGGGVLAVLLWLRLYRGYLSGAAVWAAAAALFAFGVPLLRHADRRHTLLTVVIAAQVLVCTLPMGLSPYWNGEYPAHRNQYEVMTEALVKGQLHMDYEVDPRLLALENPYDPAQRDAAGAIAEWDHAFYNGHYYMYFGVVPIFFTFLPYRLLTGEPLTSYHAAQFFAAAAILGFHALFQLLRRLFFPQLKFSRCVLFSVVFSTISLWYCVAAPALYCIPLVSAVCLEIWSLYCFVRAVWQEQAENRQILWAAGGALLGALVFGCRPPIALANVLVIPMLAVYLHQHPLTLKRLGKLAAAASPYVVVAVLLMTYNALRFDNPFEFGQSYQMTVADQTSYGQQFSAASLKQLVKAALDHFLAPFGKVDPFGGAYFNFPILLLSLGWVLPAVWQTLKKHRLTGFACVLFLLPFVITVIDALWSPYLLERYKMDVYFLMGLMSFLVIGCASEHASARTPLADSILCGLAVFALVTCIFFFLIPYDCNWSDALLYDLYEMQME